MTNRLDWFFESFLFFISFRQKRRKYKMHSGSYTVHNFQFGEKWKPFTDVVHCSQWWLSLILYKSFLFIPFAPFVSSLVTSQYTASIVMFILFTKSDALNYFPCLHLFYFAFVVFPLFFFLYFFFRIIVFHYLSFANVCSDAIPFSVQHNIVVFLHYYHFR